MNYSPWPDADEGKTHADKTNSKWYRFEWRKATWPLVRPWYGANDVHYELNEIRWMSPITFWFPFFSVRLKYFHFYIGWKPIPVHLDDAFFWKKLWWAQEMLREGALYVQLSARWGIGKID